ncbi:Ig-like domain-containing protein, partial [Vibrio kanaloae]|uniref:Ig-like domain-containing protein n=1 Tax=Vibrio kanaloae TaxID=170673 RepID=UPI00148582A9
EEALDKGIDIEHIKVDNDYTPPVPLAQYIVADSQEYCAAQGAEVAEYTSWVKFKNAHDLKGKYNWPIKHPFVVIDDETDARSYIRVSMTTDWDPISDPTSTAMGPLCVIDASLTLVPEKSKLESVANSIDTASVAVKLYGYDPSDAYITASLNEGASANLKASSVKVDENGIAIFELDSVKAETVTLTADFEGKTLSQDVRFIGDRTTANVTLRTDIDYNPFDRNYLIATLLDSNNNPVMGEDISLSSSRPDISLPTTATTKDNGEARIQVSYNKEYGDLLKHVIAPIEVTYDAAGYISTDKKSVTFTGGICDEISGSKSYEDFPERTCVKVVEESGGMYASSATKELMDFLGFKQDTSDNPEKNTYHTIDNE